MSKSYDWGNIPLDKEIKKPVVGINTQLQDIILQDRQRLELARAKRAEPVDNSLLIDDKPCDEQLSCNQLSHDVQPSRDDRLTQPDKLSHKDSLSHRAKRSRRTDLPRLVKLGSEIPVTIQPQPVQIIYNFSKRDRDINKLMPSLTGDEWKVYCYLLSITHEKSWQGETHCWTSHHVIREETGLGCRRTVGIVLESLEAKELIQRTYTGNKAVKKSQYRVFLPCEISGYVGETKLSYTPVQRDR